VRELVRTVISMGLVDEDQIREMQRWGLVDRRMVLDRAPWGHDGMVDRMNMALDAVGIQRKETELGIPAQFLRTSRRGWVHVHLNGVDVHEPIEVTYGMTRQGEYILPWVGAPGQEELLVNGRTCLDTGGKRVWMMGVRPVHFDDLQSFVVCKPGAEEARDGQCR